VRHVTTLGVAPPRDPRDRVQSGRFLRGLLARWLVVSLALWGIVALVTGAPVWVLALAGATLVLLVADVLWLSYRVRRDERRAG
jgi:hypothetical protein